MDSIKALCGPVVGSEEHKGVLVDAEVLEQGRDFTYLTVHHGVHGGRYLGVLAVPRLVLVDLPGRLVLGNLIGGMRRRPWTIEEEGLVLVVLDELDRLVVDGVMGVAPGQFDLLAVTKEMGVIGVGMPLVVIAGEEVDPLALGGSPEWSLASPAKYSS